MITNNNVWDSPVRKVTAKVGLFEGSTLVATYGYNDKLKSFSIDRVGEEKFFGFGICQRLSLQLIDTKRELDISTAHTIKCYVNCGEDLDAFPGFKVSEVRRDENTNELSITAYDALYAASAHTIAELGLLAPYTIMDVANDCAAFLGLGAVNVIGLPDGYNPFELEYPDGANLEGSELLRDVLNAIAEATQTVYYIDYNGNLIFKMPDRDGEAVLIIGKSDYIELDSKTNRRLSDICSATELGDNVITESGIIGTTQYVRDNPFWELREDIVTLLDDAVAAIGGLLINQFDCSWRGNLGLEIGDKISLVTKDNKTVDSFVFNDTITYEGSLTEQTSWSYSDSDSESADNPVSLGDTLKQTYAKVNKAEKQVDIVASNTEANAKAISSLQLSTNSINASVQDVRNTVAASINGVNNEVAEISKKVNAQMTPEQVQLQINNSLDNGVRKVETTTGFTFNDSGLHISKSGTEMSTTISEDGMQVFRDSTAVLTANNIGVDAVNLHATTYLIIGNNSRLEDWEGRSACFWIGG